MIKLETTCWQAEIAVETGGNLCRLRHLPCGLEVLRAPPDLEELRKHPVRYGIPILFPPNRLDQGKFTWQGRQYKLPLNEPERDNHLHGLVVGKPWQLVECTTESITLSYDFAAVSGYPHDFSLTMSYYFVADAVTQTFIVHNRSACPMPFGLGFHTAFNMPSDAWATITTGNDYWEIVRPRCLPSGKLLPWKKEDCIFRDDQAVSRHCPLATEIIDGKPFRGLVIHYPHLSSKLYYEVDEQYRHWYLWNDGGGQGFFCIEPMTWMVNAPNLDLPPEVTGMQCLEPGQSWRAQTLIRLVMDE